LNNKTKVTSTALLIIVMTSLMMAIATANACQSHHRTYIQIKCPKTGATTGIIVDVQGIFWGHIPNPNDRWWILVKPLDSKLVHPGAPIYFTYNDKWGGTWHGAWSIYLTGDPKQLKQPFKIMVALVTPKTDQLYEYRLAHQIYDYIEMQPGTIVFDYVIVQRVQ